MCISVRLILLLTQQGCLGKFLRHVPWNSRSSYRSPSCQENSSILRKASTAAALPKCAKTWLGPFPQGPTLDTQRLEHGCRMVVLLSLVWGWSTIMFQLSGFDCPCSLVTACTQTYIDRSVNIHEYLCRCKHTYTYHVNLFYDCKIHKCVHTYMRIHTCINKCMYVRIRTHMYICTGMYMYASRQVLLHTL